MIILLLFCPNSLTILTIQEKQAFHITILVVFWKQKKIAMLLMQALEYNICRI